MYRWSIHLARRANHKKTCLAFSGASWIFQLTTIKTSVASWESLCESKSFTIGFAIVFLCQIVGKRSRCQVFNHILSINKSNSIEKNWEVWYNIYKVIVPLSDLKSSETGMGISYVSQVFVYLVNLTLFTIRFGIV